MRNLWFLFPLVLALKSSWKSHQMTPFFVQKEVLGEKIIIWVKYVNVITQIMMFSLFKKVDDLRARGKRNHKFRTKLNNNYDSLKFLGTPLLRILMRPRRKESGCQNLRSPAQTDSAVFWEGSRKGTVIAEWISKGKEMLNKDWQPATKGLISPGNGPFGHCWQTGWEFLDFSWSIQILMSRPK